MRADVVPRRETGGKKREEKAGQAPGSTRQPIPKGFGFHSRSRYRIISDVNSSRHISSCSPENEYRFREFGQITKKEKLYTIACCARVRVDFSSVSFSFSFLIFFLIFELFRFSFFFFSILCCATFHNPHRQSNPIQFSKNEKIYIYAIYVHIYKIFKRKIYMSINIYIFHIYILYIFIYIYIFCTKKSECQKIITNKKNVYKKRNLRKKKKRTETLIVSINQYRYYTSNYYIMNYYRACCSSTGKWYLRWDLRSALSSSSSSCCHIRSYPWHSSRDIVADADGVPAWPPHNTAPAPPGLASATACHTPKIQIHSFVHLVPVISLPPFLSVSLSFIFSPFLSLKLIYH